jgi:cathepsin A (carboxypeptidase C)
MFAETGPYRPSKDGSSLEENIFSWNRFANVLYLEAPRGVGFSYAEKAGDPDGIINDTLTAQDNLEALKQFLIAFPEYVKPKNRDFYLLGQSYGNYILTNYNF